jgi:hypothetical protein
MSTIPALDWSKLTGAQFAAACDVWVYFDSVFANPAINIYNLYGRCDQPSDGSTGPRQSWALHPAVDEVSAWGFEGTDSVLPYGLDGCWGSSELFTEYLNRDDVRAAIHVKSSAEFEAMYNPSGSNETDTAWAGCGMKNVLYDGGESSDLLPLYGYLAERPEMRMLIFVTSQAIKKYMIALSFLRLLVISERGRRCV